MKFVKKKIEIEAVLWDGSPESWNAIQDLGCQPIQDESCSMFEIIIPTLEDGSKSQVKHVATKGDWIIKGIEGEFYPCKPDIFAKTYSKVLTTFEDIMIKTSLEYQRINNIEPNTEEEMREEFKDESFALLKSAVQEYASLVATEALKKAADCVRPVDVAEQRKRILNIPIELP